MNTKAYGATAPDSGINPLTIHRRSLRDDDVAITIDYCGVCHSDIHTVENDWGRTSYPLVPGHEIVGTVTEVGPRVSKYKVGDTVGVGCLVDSCGTCPACNDHQEQFCDEGIHGTYGGTDRIDGTPNQGGYSEAIVVKEAFVLSIPDGLDPAAAAPILCAGITTYSPLKYAGVTKGDKVGVLGMGGLGHMGVKFAKAMGAEVTIFTRSESKVQEALQQGADHVIISTNEQQMQAATEQFDYLLDTIPVEHDFNPYLNCLKYNGTHIVVGQLTPLEPALNTGALVMKRRSILGSLIGGLAETQEVLNFCATHNISCDIEMLDIQHINAAYERMKKGDVKYRFVIDMNSLRNS
tara:strand:+ start:1150 stop:2202 length:1053 start_codon:yes stop_codon:yes gene_type:complete